MLALIKDDKVVGIHHEDSVIKVGDDWLHGGNDGWSNDAGYRLETIRSPEGPSDLSTVELVDGHPTWAAATQPAAASNGEVDAERDRRLAQPFVIQSGGKTYTMAATKDERDTLTAQMVASMSSLSSWTGIFRDGANVNHKIDAKIIQTLFNESEARRTAIVLAAAKIKGTSPVPPDFANDKYWPNIFVP